ncbi:hypothetical protein AAGG52_12825 [Bacillus licheniformis]
MGKNKEEFKKRMAEAHGSKVAGAFLELLSDNKVIPLKDHFV